MELASQENESSYQFDAFELDPVRRRLLRDGKAIALKPKVFETLLVLVRNSGRVMNKDELMQQVWPDTVVEEVNLAHNISVIRKALGQRSEENRFIITVPGRGYGFVAEVTEIQHNLPIPSPALPEYELTRSRLVVEEESDAGDLAKELGMYAEDAGTQQLNQAVNMLPGKRQKTHRPRRSILFLTAALIALLLVGAGFFVRFYSQQRNNDGNGETPFAQTRIKQLTTKGTVRWATLSRDGKFYAYSLTERAEAKESLWLGQTDSGNDIQLLPPGDAIYYGLSFSPDGRMLYFSVTGDEHSQNGLFNIPVLGGVAEKLSDNLNTQFALSPDGTHLAVFRTSKQTGASALVITNLDGTEMRELVTRAADKPFGAGACWPRTVR